MNTQEKIANLKAEKYQELFGVKKPVFDEMLEILVAKEKPINPKGGRPPKLTTLDKLVIMLEYYHDYPTMNSMAFRWGVAKSQICEAVKWAEKTIIKDGRFSLPSKRKLLECESEIQYVIVDATECRTERPQKGQKLAYSGKKNAIR